jgi:hypothetical protein
MGAWISAFVIAAILLPFQAAEQEEKPAGAAVSGTVIHSLTREPVRRAEVTLVPVPASPAQPQRTGGGRPSADSKPAPRTAVTGPDGGFRFDNVAEGTYWIAVRREGMVAGRPAPGLSPVQIRVRDGVPISGLRYALTPQAVISGRVVDDEGEPVPGIQILALRRAPPEARSGSLTASGGAQTDDRGEYRLRNLPAGRYLVQAAPMMQRSMQTAENRRTALVATFHPDAASPEGAIWVSVGEGQEAANINIQLRRMPVFRISGRVLLEDGKPAERFMVSNIESNAPATYILTGRMDLGKEPGSFVLDAVPPGSWTLVARLMDNPALSMQRAAFAHVDVSGRDVEGVEIRFLPPFVLHGQVRVEGLGAEQAKAELAKLQITAMPLPVGFSFAQASVKGDGSFEMTMQAPGRYRIHVYPGASPQLYLASIRTSGGADVLKEIDLSAGASETISITMRTDAARITAQRPKAEKEEEVCNPYYAAAIQASEEERLVRPPVFAPVDESGQAVLFPVPPGEYFVFGVCAADPMFTSDPDLLESLAQKAEKIRVQAGEQKTITVKDATPQ